MAELLLELFSEEIPAGFQLKAVKDFEDGITERLNAEGIGFKVIRAFATPRRVALLVNGLPQAQRDSTEERRGPRVGAPDQALDGFLKSSGLTKEQLEIRNTDKGDFYFAVIKKQGRPVAEVLAGILNDFIGSYTWPKSMKWGNHAIRWIRPLHSILCLFDGRILPVSLGHVSAGNRTFGHRFLSPAPIEVRDFDDYKTKLKAAHVILDAEERKRIIENEANALAQNCGATVRPDPGLLGEVAGLVEWPVPLLGRIEEKFMVVPPEVLITAMRSHQKYFSLTNDKGKLAPYFITISNTISEDKGAVIIHGNERVLRARLEDAKFFWDQDRRNSLESRVEGLDKVIFHAQLGTVLDKVTRMEALAKLLSIWVPFANLGVTERAARLCKADLTTEMVGEFPELQGLMGSYYALESREDPAIAAAVKEHYRPVGPTDICPTAPVSVTVALADKIDTLVGLFAIGEKPTGSKDPYALRRAALGVIRIILENNLRIPLRLLLEKAAATYPKTLFKGEKKGRKLLPVGGKESVKHKHAEVASELLEFLAERLRVLLKEKNLGHDRIQAVFDGGNEDDLTRLVARVQALEEFLSTEDGANLFAAYKRATNIVLAEEKKDQISYNGEPDKNLLEAIEEQDLSDLFAKTRPQIEKRLKSDDFTGAMRDLATLRKPVDEFFEAVVVNCDNPNIRRNRLLLLSQFRASLHKVANFGLLEG